MSDLFGYRYCLGLMVVVASLSACSKPLGRGEIHGRELPDSVLEDKASRQESVADTVNSQILFGDLHVHTTLLPDAGMNTPATSTFDKQLNRAQHDPDRQILFEVYSGHGNSEEYRSWRGSVKNKNGELSCLAPSDG